MSESTCGEFSTIRDDSGDALWVTCSCGGFIIQRDKGLGRANIAAWKSRHQPKPTATPPTTRTDEESQR